MKQNTSQNTVIHRFPDHVELLLEVLQYRRPAGSKTEERFIKEHLMKYNPSVDAAGNVIVDIPGPGRNILWSSHTDTVHTMEGFQDIFISKTNIIHLYIEKKPEKGKDGKVKVQSNCLGADDGAGVWLMMMMIEAKKPGLYIFHRGEEKGGIGSGHIASRSPELLEGIDAAIALDRKGYTSIITHQCGRSASDEFAASLGTALATAGLDGMKADSGGLFTDTKNYAGIIKECTNLSVGYSSAHSPSETLDINFMEKMRIALLALDTSDLVFTRDPKEVVRYNTIYNERGGLYEDDYIYKGYANGRTWGGGRYGTSEFNKTANFTPLNEKRNLLETERNSFDEKDADGNSEEDYIITEKEKEDIDSYEQKIDEIADLLKDKPYACAALLYDYGFSFEDIADELDYLY